ncbi:hypothetical protein [Niallia taxi]|uniref:hypothetical protein n=1 Tax=Niallia taxi TaxID=2499688 RepID=UPI00300A00DC
MEFTLLDNGIDSLKKTELSIQRFNQLHRPNSYHLLKDAIIYLNHGIEILLKYLLTEQHESLIFKDLRLYLEARKQLKYMSPKENGFGTYLEKNKPTVFDVVEKGKRLETITLTEALHRVECLCDTEITKEFKSSIFLINKYRNDITHHSIKLSEFEEQKFIHDLKMLYINTLDFFSEHISELYVKVDVDRFEVTLEEAEQWQRDMEEFYQERALSDLSED